MGYSPSPENGIRQDRPSATGRRGVGQPHRTHPSQPRLAEQLAISSEQNLRDWDLTFLATGWGKGDVYDGRVCGWAGSRRGWVGAWVGVGVELVVAWGSRGRCVGELYQGHLIHSGCNRNQ